MKLISARSSFAPRSQYSAKRAPGDLGGALEIENAEFRTQVPVRLRLRNRIAAARRSGAPRRSRSASRPTGTDSCGTLGMPGQQFAELLVERLHLLVEAGDLVADGAHLLLPLGGVRAFAAQLADLLRFGVPARLQLLGSARWRRGAAGRARGTGRGWGGWSAWRAVPQSGRSCSGSNERSCIPPPC